jgi:hypothetical protein
MFALNVSGYLVIVVKTELSRSRLGERKKERKVTSPRQWWWRQAIAFH